MFRYLTAGESHGPSLNVIIEGCPAGLSLTPAMINKELARRQQGYGRGGRMQIEKDQVMITSGVRHGETLGSPIAMTITNRDWKNWTEIMSAEAIAKAGDIRRINRPRPGHADLVGALKYDRSDIRDILERASARETAARVAVGAVAKVFLEAFEVQIGSWVDSIGGVAMKSIRKSPKQLIKLAEKSEVRCPDTQAESGMIKAIDKAVKTGDTLGGIFTVTALGLVPGLGSHVHWDKRLDMRLAGALMSIQAIKGVEFGMGFECAHLPGSKVHDAVTHSSKNDYGYGRRSNNAGGVEGGMSTGLPLVARAAMKPIATLKQPLSSVDMKSKKTIKAGYERSDNCAVPAAAVVGEAMVAIELATLWQEKFGGDAIKEVLKNVLAYKRYLQKR